MVVRKQRSIVVDWHTWIKIELSLSSQARLVLHICRFSEIISTTFRDGFISSRLSVATSIFSLQSCDISVVAFIIVTNVRNPLVIISLQDLIINNMVTCTKDESRFDIHDWSCTNFSSATEIIGTVWWNIKRTISSHRTIHTRLRSIHSFTVSTYGFRYFWSCWTVRFTSYFRASYWWHFITWASHLWARNRSNSRCRLSNLCWYFQRSSLADHYTTSFRGSNFTANKLRSWRFRSWSWLIEDIGNSFWSCLVNLGCFRIIYSNFIVRDRTCAIGLFLSPSMPTKHQACTNQDWCSSKRIFTNWVTLTFLKNKCLSHFDHSHFLGCFIK